MNSFYYPYLHFRTLERLKVGSGLSTAQLEVLLQDLRRPEYGVLVLQRPRWGHNDWVIDRQRNQSLPPVTTVHILGWDEICFCAYKPGQSCGSFMWGRKHASQIVFMLDPPSPVGCPFKIVCSTINRRLRWHPKMTKRPNFNIEKCFVKNMIKKLRS